MIHDTIFLQLESRTFSGTCYVLSSEKGGEQVFCNQARQIDDLKTDHSCSEDPASTSISEFSSSAKVGKIYCLRKSRKSLEKSSDHIASTGKGNEVRTDPDIPPPLASPPPESSLV